MIIRLLGNRVLIEPLKAPSPTLHLPLPHLPSGTVIEQPNASPAPFGTVRLLGSTVREPLQVGDLVRLNTDRGSVEVEFQNLKCRIYSVLDVQAVLTNAL